MSKVSKEMVYAVKMARWEEWQRMAQQLPRGRHILSVELLRTHRNETAVVLTVVHNGKLVQYELRGDVHGGNARPVVTQHRAPADCDQPGTPDQFPRLETLTTMALTTDSGDGGPVADGIALGEPPPKEDPLPGALALGGSLLTTTFNLGEQAVDSTVTT